MRFGRSAYSPEVLQIFEYRQILDLELYPQTLRMLRTSQKPVNILLRTSQWNGFVELLPLWLAPNMVTLLGFCFILWNVICLEIWMPDLVGPVRSSLRGVI